MSNGFSAADMTDARAKGYQDRVEFEKDHIGDANKMVGAAQEVVRKPDGYHYRYPTLYGTGTYIRRNNGEEVNGSKPIEAVPYWYAAPVAAAPVVDVATLRALSDRWANDRSYTGSPVDDIRALIEQPTTSTPAAPGITAEWVIKNRNRPHATKQAAPKELWGRKLTRSERQCWAQGFNAATIAAEPIIPEPNQECYSDSDGESWFDDPADSCIVDGMAVGDTYTLQVSHYSVGRTYRVTKVPDETSDYYEVEPVQATSAEVGA